MLDDLKDDLSENLAMAYGKFLAEFLNVGNDDHGVLSCCDRFQYAQNTAVNFL